MPVGNDLQPALASKIKYLFNKNVQKSHGMQKAYL